MSAHAGYIDDAALVRGFFEEWVAEAAHFKYIFYIYVHNVVKLIFRKLFRTAFKGSACIIYKKVKDTCGRGCNLS